MEETALQELLAQVARDELREHDGTREQSLAQFRDWIDKTQEIQNCRTDDNFLLRFLRVRKFNLPMAQKNLLKFLKLPHHFPFLENLDLKDPDVDAMISQGVEFGVPDRDEKSRQLIILNLGNIDPSINKHQDFMRTNYLNCCTLLEDEVSQVLGFVYVVNASGTGLRHASFWPPVEFVKHTIAIQTVFPMRFKEIHIFNLPSVVRWLFDIFVSASTEKIRNRIFIHNSLEDLHKVVNPKLLPEEMGGTTPMKSMIDLWKERVERNRDAVSEVRKIKLLHIEDKSISDADVFGIQGSFRTLCVD